jgi:hypothetical protein
MKAFFLTGSIVLTVLILILAFENIAASCGGFLFLFMPMEGGFFVTFALSFIGIIAGMFYAGYLSQLLRSKQEDEEPPGGEW